jgi:hypothetical protein
MPSINGRFSDQNDLVVTGQVQTANNNQIALNASLAETDQIRGSSVVLQPTGLLATPPNLVPGVTTTLLGTIGAALSGEGQQGTASNEPGGGGIPCFLGVTSIRLANGGFALIHDIRLNQMVVSFDPMNGEWASGRVTDKFEHLVDGYMLIEFEDGHSTGVDKEGNHRYWVGQGLYAPIRELSSVWHWNDGWKERKIVNKKVIEEETIVYNMTVEGFHNYLANNDGVSNLKPVDDD